MVVKLAYFLESLQQQVFFLRLGLFKKDSTQKTGRHFWLNYSHFFWKFWNAFMAFIFFSFSNETRLAPNKNPTKLGTWGLERMWTCLEQRGVQSNFIPTIRFLGFSLIYILLHSICMYYVYVYIYIYIFTYIYVLSLEIQTHYAGILYIFIYIHMLYIYILQYIYICI